MNRLVPWLMVASGGFLIWSAIANRKPADVLKAIASGEMKTAAELPEWAAAVQADTGNIAPAPGTPTVPNRIGGSDPGPVTV